MNKQLGSGAVVAVVVVGILFSAYNNLALFLSILGGDLKGWVASLAGLALFDAGAVGWALFFSNGATGGAQRAVAFVASLACLILTITGAAMHLLLVQKLIVAPEWAGQAAMFTIIAALAINIASGYAAHMFDPAVSREMKLRAAADEIFEEATKQLKTKTKQIAGSVAESLSDEMRDDVIRIALGATAGGDNRGTNPGQLTGAIASGAGVSAPGAVAESEPKSEGRPTIMSTPVYLNGVQTRAKADAGEAPKG